MAPGSTCACTAAAPQTMCNSSAKLAYVTVAYMRTCYAILLSPGWHHTLYKFIDIPYVAVLPEWRTPAAGPPRRWDTALRYFGFVLFQQGFQQTQQCSFVLDAFSIPSVPPCTSYQACLLCASDFMVSDGFKLHGLKVLCQTSRPFQFDGERLGEWHCSSECTGGHVC